MRILAVILLAAAFGAGCVIGLIWLWFKSWEVTNKRESYVSKTMKKLSVFLLLLPLFLIGCADLNTNAYHSERLAADVGVSGVHTFNVYYGTATNGAAPAKIDELNKTRDQVYDASRKLSAVLAVTEAARLAYSTNATPANEATLRSALSALSANSGNITGLVDNAMSPFSPLTK